MDFWRTVTVLFRRWYISIPAFLATLGVAAAAYSVAPTQYQSESILVLTTPVSGGTEATRPTSPSSLTNPLMNFDRSLSLAAAIVIQQMNSPKTAEAVGIPPAGAVTYRVTNGSSNPELLESGPFVFVEGTAPTPELAQDVIERVSATAAEVLDRRQTDLNAPASTHISMQVLVPPTAGQALTGSPKRAAAATGALAGLASLASVFGFESLMTRRRRPAAVKQRVAAQVRRLPATGALYPPVGPATVDHPVNGVAAHAASPGGRATGD